MSLKIGELAGILDLDSRPFDDKLGGIDGKLSGLGRAVAGVALGMGVALGGAAIAGTMAFAGFDKGMREVFTLLPGISQPAMDKMTGQVKDFATEFGVLPDQVVPALYQSLSAGVPPDNVFAFLEVAQKAAKGGVTDLTTAVDGITSVVNAYGSEVVDATKASDLMFTAVKLGKTNFSELSASLFNVTPTAAALGVKFEDVTAALAAMTLQGVPTSVATTQLRQLLVELSKEGSTTSDVFEEISGRSFKDFIAGGGDMQGALQLIEQHAKASGLGVNDLFGSVEAGAAALALTGGGTAAFSTALDGMASSAGATEQAFGTMNGGISASFDRIKARLSVAVLDVTEQFAPYVEAALEGVIGFFDNLAKQVGNLIDVFRSGDDVAEGFAEVMDNIFGNTGKTIPVFRALFDIGKAIVTFVSNHWQPVLVGLGAVILALGGPLFVVIGALVAAYARFEWFRDGVAAAVGFVSQVFGDFAGWVRQIWPQVEEAITHVVHALQDVWARFGDRFVNVAEALFGAVSGVVQGIVQAIGGLIEFVVALVNGDWGRAWDAFVKVVDGLGEALRAILVGAGRAMREALLAIIPALGEVAGRIVSTVLGALGNLAQAMGRLGVDAMRALVNGLGVPLYDMYLFFYYLPSKIIGWIGNIAGTLYDAGRNLIGGLVRGVGDSIPSLSSILGSITNSLTSWKGPPERDAVILRRSGQLVMDGFIRGIDDRVGALAGRLGAMTSMVEFGVAPSISAGSRLTAAAAGSAAVTHNTFDVRVEGIVGDDRAVIERIRAGIREVVADGGDAFGTDR